MTLRISLDDIRARVAERKRRRADLDATLRDRGVAILKPSARPPRSLIARVLPWTRNRKG